MVRVIRVLSNNIFRSYYWHKAILLEICFGILFQKTFSRCYKSCLTSGKRVSACKLPRSRFQCPIKQHLAGCHHKYIIEMRPPLPFLTRSVIGERNNRWRNTNNTPFNPDSNIRHLPQGQVNIEVRESYRITQSSKSFPNQCSIVQIYIFALL